MEIYGIEVQYKKGKSSPVLCSAKVAKESALFYFVEGHPGFLGYSSRVPKTTRPSFSPRHAWEVYVDRCNTMRANLRAEAETLAEFQSIGIAHLQDLQEADC